MIGEIMDYCNNHFLQNSNSGEFVIDASGKTITGTFDTDYYDVGGYINVYGSHLNDTTFTIVSVTSTVITVDDTLYDEDNTDKNYTIYIFGCRPPRSFLSLVADINTWVEDNGTTGAGLSSEKIDDYSVSYGSGITNGGAWQSAFANRLAQFRAVYSDIDTYYRY